MVVIVERAILRCILDVATTAKYQNLTVKFLVFGTWKNTPKYPKHIYVGKIYFGKIHFKDSPY